MFTYGERATDENKVVNYETQRKITSFNGNNNATKLTNDAKRKSMTVVECNIKVKRTKWGNCNAINDEKKRTEKSVIHSETIICENISDGKRLLQNETNDTNTNISNHL